MSNATTNVDEFTLPKFFRLKQEFASLAVDDVEHSVDDALNTANLPSIVNPNQRVAIAVGSRGIRNLPVIVQTVVKAVRRLGATPLIVPAMGSHGGATAAGQAALLANLGVTEDFADAPIVSSMETVLVGSTDNGLDIHFDRVASGADHVFLINRVKPHTRLVGDFESGLVKMLMIGLGKHLGAALYHEVFADHEYHLDKLVHRIVPMLLNRMPISLGLAIVEDAYESTSLVEAVLPNDLMRREPELLRIARSRMPSLPFDAADLLIVDQIGKEISGTGMDTNVIGRKANDKVAARDEYPKVREIYVRGLSKKSAGNATGIGIAEYCHRRVAESIDVAVTRVNCVTSQHASAGALPLTFDSDRDVLRAVISQSQSVPANQRKWLRIRNTLELGEVICSEAFYSQAKDQPNLEVLCEPSDLSFDRGGDFETMEEYDE